MCTLAIYRDVSERYPLVVAANRDEFLARAAVAPARWPHDRAVVAGRDLEGAGTWLGCRVEGPALVAGVLNRRPGPTERASGTGELSRGRLCIDALGKRSVDDAEAAVREAELSRYGGFNLLLADRTRAVVIDNRAGDPVATELGPGLSVLTNLDVNDPRCARLAGAVPEFERVLPELAADVSVDRLVERLGAVLGDHRNSADPANTDPLARLCVHTEGYGTRSSTVIVCQSTGPVHYFHAPDAPCRAPFARVEY